MTPRPAARVERLERYHRRLRLRPSASPTTRRLLPVLGLAITALGCSSPTVVDAGGLAGRWQSPRESLQPAGSYQTTFTFRNDGGVTWEARLYGLYPGQGPDDLSAYSRTTGMFRITAESLLVRSQVLVSWDQFYGADSPAQIITYDSTSVVWRSHYSLEADHLTLQYLSYPADAPVPTTATYVRVP